MKTLATPKFMKMAHKQGIENSQLLAAVADMMAGLGNAKDLGQHLHQVRVAKGNRGKSAGFRTYAMVVASERAIFLYAFQKTDGDNLSRVEMDMWRRFSKSYAEWSDAAVDAAIAKGELVKIE